MFIHILDLINFFKFFVDYESKYEGWSINLTRELNILMIQLWSKYILRRLDWIYFPFINLKNRDNLKNIVVGDGICTRC